MDEIHCRKRGLGCLQVKDITFANFAHMTGEHSVGAPPGNKQGARVQEKP